jgi:hypothetical protein
MVQKGTGTRGLSFYLSWRDHQATAADIILYDTNNHKLYYVSFKT